MALLKVAEVNEKAASLKNISIAGTNAVNVLISLKAQILALRDVVTNDTDNYTQEDIDDVNQIIDSLNSAIQGI